MDFIYYTKSMNYADYRERSTDFAPWNVVFIGELSDDRQWLRNPSPATQQQLALAESPVAGGTPLPIADISTPETSRQIVQH